MANKIPVGAAIAQAYRFAFRDFPKVLGVTWLPLAAQLALSLLMMQRATVFMTAIVNRDPSAMSQFGSVILLYPLVLVLFTSQFAAVTQLTLGQRTVPPWFHLPLDKPVWRLIGAILVAVLALAAIAVAFLAVGAIIIFLLRLALQASAAAKPVLALATALLFLAAYCGLILIAFRFLFLLAPVTLAEGRVSPVRSWQLSYGNFWRMFLITLAILVPVVIVEYGVILGAIGLPPLPHPGESRQAFEAARLAWNLQMVGAMTRYWFIALPLFGVLMVFWFGAGCSAQTFAYRHLTASAPVPRHALP